MPGLRIHSSVDNTYLGEGRFESRSGSGSSLTFQTPIILSKRKRRKNDNSDKEFAEENERRIQEREQLRITNVQPINSYAVIQDEITVTIDTPIDTNNLQP
ncbi:5243_t:CDS:2 [Scutellospora calospora]|uniref:5243_t:CDS:1 n=1 Tax=Scutellospora calospora TaxID=85575 RepID=A0ACA9JTU2_9GLOM|nr:5243_t:CDS:2 [Scutellospora calospora]